MYAYVIRIFSKLGKPGRGFTLLHIIMIIHIMHPTHNTQHPRYGVHETCIRAFLISFCIFFTNKICIYKCFSHLRPLQKTALSETEMT